MATDDTPIFCDRCTKQLVAGSGDFFVVTIEAVADPSPPRFEAEDLQIDHRREIRRIVREMEQISGQELMDQVYRRLKLCLCNRCYFQWIEDPTGT